MSQATISAEDLGIDIRSGKEQEVFMKHDRDTPGKIQNCSWQELVDLLGEGGYTRYDESTASNLLEITRKLLDEYDGKISNIYDSSDNKKDFESRLQEFKDVGPKTVEIFMREVKPVWFS